MRPWYIFGLEESDWLDRLLFGLTIFGVIAIAGLGISFPDAFAARMSSIFAGVLEFFGWWYILLGFILSVAMLYFAFSRFGNLKLGGPDAEPEFDLFSWFSMVFTVGFAASVIFWGVAEPISIVNSPPGNVPIGGAPIESVALAFMYLHDILPGLIAWFFPLSIAFGLIIHGDNDIDYKISSILTPILDKEKYGGVYWLVDLAAMVAIVGGLSTSLGLIGQQFSAIISGVYGFNADIITYAFFVIIGFIFLGDIWLGLRRGIRNVARITVVLVVALFALIFVLGPTLFTLNLGIDAMGIWLGNMPRLMLFTDPMGEGLWAQNWTSFWWAWFAAWGIFVGSFVARVSKGRTIREIFVGLCVAPAAFLVMQHAILGGWVLHPSNIDAVSQALTDGGTVAALVEAINITPLSAVLGVLFMLVLAGYLLTSLDSAVYMLAAINLGDAEPNTRNRAWWGVVLALLGIMTLELPNASVAESFAGTLSLPFTLFFLAAIYATYIAAKGRYQGEFVSMKRTDARTDTDTTKQPDVTDD